MVRGSSTPAEPSRASGPSCSFCRSPSRPLLEVQELLFVFSGEMVLQEGHQVLENVDVLSAVAHDLEALHEHGPVRGLELIPVPLAVVTEVAGISGTARTRSFW